MSLGDRSTFLDVYVSNTVESMLESGFSDWIWQRGSVDLKALQDCSLRNLAATLQARCAFILPTSALPSHTLTQKNEEAALLQTDAATLTAGAAKGRSKVVGVALIKPGP